MTAVLKRTRWTSASGQPPWIGEAQRLYDEGASLKTVAAELGVEKGTIHRWIVVPPERQRTPPKPPVALTCAHCKKPFTLLASVHSRYPRKYCSNACQGLAERKQRTCTICGSSFFTVGLKARRTCSTACRNEAIGRTKRGPLSKSYKNGDTALRKAWRDGKEDFCRNCGTNSGRLYQHHVVYEQHVRKRGGDPYDLNNSLTVCRDCHLHHHAGKHFRVTILRPENLKFAYELLGDYAEDYFTRFYNDGGPLMRFLEDGTVAA